MAFTPSSSPLQYQYKPLNLMAFAEPLAKMQEKYDLTKSTIEDSDVKATSLQWAQDPEKAKALEQIYRNKRDELAQNLAETKNYTQAASKIKKLQRLWNEDPERLALESNYKLWEERNKAELERVAKGDITKAQYTQWFTDEKRKFESEEVGGTNFRRDDINPNGTYNPVTSKIGREKDLQKDFDELKYKVAGDIKAKKWSGALSSMGIDPMSEDAKYVQSEFEKLTPQEIDQKVEQYIRGLDRFKPWLNEIASYNLKDYKYANDEGASYNALTSELLTKNYNANEAYIKSLEKAKKTDSEDYKEAIKNKEFLREQMDNPDERVIKDLFTRDYLNRQYDAKALGDIFAVNNSSTSYTFRDLPKDGEGEGSLSAEDVAEGVFTPGTSLPVIGDLNKQRVTSGKQLFSNLAPVNNIANGDFRTINLGKVGSAGRTKLQENPALQRDRQERIFTLAVNSKNSDDFYKKLIANGFKDGVTKQNAANVFNALQDPTTKATVVSTFENGRDSYNGYVDAKVRLKHINEQVLENKEFKGSVAALGEEKQVVTLKDAEALAKLWKTTVPKLIQSGVISSNTSALEEGTVTEFKMSGNNIAKLHGFKSLEDAINNSANIQSMNGSLGNKIDKNKQRIIENLDNAQVMSFRYTGNKALNEALNEQFSSIGNLTEFKPVATKEWANTPGFDEKGNLAPGTSFDFANGQSIRLVKHNTELYYEVPVTVKTKDGQIKKTILIEPKAGTNKTQEKFLQYIIQQANNQDTDPTAKETYDMAQSAMYNLKNGSKLSEVAADSYIVGAGDPPLVLETAVGSPKAGTSYQLVKVHVNKDRPPAYKIRIVNTAGNSVFAFDNDGTKEFSTSNLNAAKVRLSELLY